MTLAQDVTRHSALDSDQSGTAVLSDKEQGATLGPFDIDLSVTLKEEYTDNVFITKNDKSDDFVTILSPRVSISLDRGRYELGLSAGADFARHFAEERENYDDAFVGVDGQFKLTPRLILFGGGEYALRHEARESPDDQSGLEPTQFDRASVFAGGAARFGKLSTRIGAKAFDLDFDDTPAVGGVVINNDDRDRTQAEIGARIGYDLGKNREVFAHLIYDGRRYDDNTDDLGFERSSDGVRVSAGGRLTLGQVEAELSAGLIHQNYDDARLKDVSTLDVDGELSWTPAIGTTLTASLDRSLQETTLSGASSYLSTSAGVRLTKQIASDFSANAFGFFTENDYQGIERTDHVVSTGLGVRYYLGPHLYLDGDVRHLRRSSDAAGADFAENRIGLTLGTQLDRAFAESGARYAAIDGDGLYVGALFSHGSLTTGLDGPRGAGGRNTADFGDNGFGAGAFAGYGIQIDNVHMGAEISGDVSETEWGHTAGRNFGVERRDSVGLDFLLGYAFANEAILYARTGVVGTRFKTPYLRAGVSNDRDERELGVRVGAGLEIPVTANISGRMEYAITSYRDYDVGIGASTDLDNFSNEEGIARFALLYKFGARAKPNPPAVDFTGPYAGVQVGMGALASDNTGPRTENTFDLAASRSSQGPTGGIHAGYGRTFGDFYLGAEVEAEASGTDWNIERGPNGRVYSVEKQHSVGAAVRAGYVINDAFLVYGRAGAVVTNFDTDYQFRGASVSQDDDRVGVRVGAGVEMAASKKLRLRLDYTHTEYDAYSVDYGTGVDRFDNSENLFRIGLSYAF